MVAVVSPGLKLKPIWRGQTPDTELQMNWMARSSKIPADGSNAINSVPVAAAGAGAGSVIDRDDWIPLDNDEFTTIVGTANAGATPLPLSGTVTEPKMSAAL